MPAHKEQKLYRLFLLLNLFIKNIQLATASPNAEFNQTALLNSQLTTDWLETQQNDFTYNHTLPANLTMEDTNEQPAQYPTRLKLYQAIANKDLPQVKTILAERHVLLNEREPQNGNTALLLACRMANINIVQQLIKHGANVNLSNYDGLTCLHLAAQSNDLALVKLLLTSKADVTRIYSGTTTAFQTAVHSGYIDAANLILERGGDGTNYYPLVAKYAQAIQHGNAEEFNKAIDLLNEVITGLQSITDLKTPANKKYHDFLGSAYYARAAYAESLVTNAPQALADSEQVIKYALPRVSMYEDRLMFLIQHDKIDDALKLVTKGLEIFQKNIILENYQVALLEIKAQKTVTINNLAPNAKPSASTSAATRLEPAYFIWPSLCLMYLTKFILPWVQSIVQTNPEENHSVKSNQNKWQLLQNKYTKNKAVALDTTMQPSKKISKTKFFGKNSASLKTELPDVIHTNSTHPQTKPIFKQRP